MSPYSRVNGYHRLHSCPEASPNLQFVGADDELIPVLGAKAVRGQYLCCEFCMLICYTTHDNVYAVRDFFKVRIKYLQLQNGIDAPVAQWHR